MRYDQYESPGFRSILWWIVLGCTVVLTIPLAIYFLANDNYIYGLFPIVLCFGAIYLANKERKEYRAAYQARRDEAAIKLFNAVRSGDEQKFAVFLRPFHTTDDLQQIKPKMEPVQELDPTSWDPTAPPGTVTVRMRTTLQPRIHAYPLEDTIVEAFRDTMPVVALGKPGETHGVGRILVDDENWQSAASELMPRALLLICVPSSRPESQWELNQIIRTHYLTKTVFIMPPSNWKQLRGDWDLVEQQLSANGIAIPKYDPEGLLFSFDAKGQCITETLRLDSSEELQKAITRLNSAVATASS
jgi:hypothetical protein